MPQLQVRQGGEVLRLLNLDMRQLSIGRTPDNGLPLRDRTVAIRHAELLREGGGWLLSAATNELETFINGHPLLLQQPHQLQHGDEVQIGVFTLTFLLQEQPDALDQVSVPPPPLETGELEAIPAAPPHFVYPPLSPARDTDALYNRYLPPFFQESTFLQRYLKIFEAVWEPLQARQDNLHLHFDPRYCPPQVLPWLARCLGVPFEREWPEARQRAWVASAVSLYHRRGTRLGLEGALEAAYGVTPVIREDPARPYTLTIWVALPADADEQALRRFITHQLPAHVAVDLHLLSSPTGTEHSDSTLDEQT